MDYDRKSTVSSFYGDRRSSYDALNRDYHPTTNPGAPSSPAPGSTSRAARRESTSSFYQSANSRGPGAMSPTSGAHPPPSAGYNRSLYWAMGREEQPKDSFDPAAPG